MSCIPDNAIIEPGTPAELFSTDVNLDDGRILGKELLVRKVRSDHHQKVAIHHCVIAGRKSEETGHAHVERVVVLDELLPAHACTMGACSLPAISINSDALRRSPLPQGSCIFFDSLRIFASAVISSSEGYTLGPDSGKCRRGSCSTASLKATSPGMAITETPRRESAVRIAISRMRGICSGWETSSQKWLHCAKRCSGLVSWK